MWFLYRDGVLLCCLLPAVTIGTPRLSYAIFYGLYIDSQLLSVWHGAFGVCNEKHRVFCYIQADFFLVIVDEFQASEV